MNKFLVLLFFAAAIFNAVLFFSEYDTDKLVIAGLFVACAFHTMGDIAGQK